MKNALGAVQTVLVLGGDSDIAQATLFELIERGTRTIILAGRDTDAMEGRAADLRSRGATDVTVARFDAVDFSSHEAFVASVFDREGDIDLVFLAFGVLGDQLRDENNAARAIQTIQVNYTGAVSVLIPIVERMKKQGHGDIVVMSTVAAERARRSNFIYGSSKAGLDWFAQGLGDALQGSGVSVMVVRPGFVRSSMTAHMDDAPMAVTPQDVASSVVQGIAKGRETVWVPGKLRWVMFVLRHLPRFIFRRLKI